MLREVWLSNFPSTLSGVSSLNASSSDYHREVIPTAAMPKLASFNESTRYSQKLSGYFIAPKEDDYSFLIKSDDDSELYFSTTESPKNKVRIIVHCDIRSYFVKRIVNYIYSHSCDIIFINYNGLNRHEQNEFYQKSQKIDQILQR